MENVQFDIQFLNEQAEPVRQYKIPEKMFNKTMLDVKKLMKDNKVYSVNIRKSLPERIN